MNGRSASRFHLNEGQPARVEKRDDYQSIRIWRLVAAVGLVALLAACGGSHKSTAKESGPKPPPVACPASGQSVDTKATTLAADTPHGATWAGVFERIFVKTDMNGTVSKTPIQHTLVSAAGQGTPTVEVPMSSDHLRHSLGKKPNVVNGVAQVTLDLKKRAVERLKSDYERPLPLGVRVDYKLDGKPISSSDVKGKSGKVEVDYRLTNTTAKPVSVCFRGFNGKVVKQKVSEPAPIYAYVSLTLPKHISQFTAPGAVINADRKGVEPQWWIAMFKPVAPTTQTLKLTMDTKKAKIPQASIIVWFVVPEALTGSVPAQSAAAIGKAQADAAAAAAKVQADVAALQAKTGKPSKARQISASGGSRRTRSSSPRGSSSTAEFAQLQSQIATIGHADTTFLQALGPTENELSGSTTRLIDGLSASSGSSIARLTASTNQTIDGLTAGTSRTIDRLTASTSRSIGHLATELHRSLRRASLHAVVAGAGHLQRMALAVGTLAGRLVPEVKAVADGVRGVVASLPAPVANALQLYLLFGQLNQDLAAFSPAVKATAAFVKLQADISAGQALAKTVSDSLNAIQAKAQEIAGTAATLQQDAARLQTRIGAVLRTAVANAKQTTQTLLGRSVKSLTARLAAATAAAGRNVAGLDRSARQRLAAARSSAQGDVTAAASSARGTVASAENQARAALAVSLRHARQSVTRDERKLESALRSARKKANEALAAAKAKAKQSGQTALANAQASAAKAQAAAQTALTKANDDYAHLLALNQQAVAWALPGGDATHVTEQEGSLIYTISGS